MNTIEYRSPELKVEMAGSFGTDFEDVALAMFGEYGLDGFALEVCPRLVKNGEAAFGQLRLRCAALVSNLPNYKRMWLSLHYCRAEIRLALYHEIHHVLYPQLAEEDIEYLEKEWGNSEKLWKVI